MAAQTINTGGFISEFLRRHELLPDRPFCWVLGSGASFQSGIPTGGALATQWLKELHEMEDLENRPIEEWATAKNLGIKNFDYKNLAAFYPWIYWRRFRKFREEGYAFLEKVMDDIEPSYGYSVLAQIMAGKQHKAAVTTNFDNLVADALAIYTRALPLVCGHESLTGFIRPNLQRPLVAKIHRDLLLNPKNEPEELEKLPTEWVSALTTIFANYTPIVIGYGGNDGSLMGLLKTLPPIKGGIFWCYRIGDKPDARIQEIVAHHDGSLVPILGFDELMLQLWEKLKLPSPIPDLQTTHDKRKADFQEQFEELNKRLKEPGKTQVAEAELKEVRASAAAAVERLTKEKNWWSWQLRAKDEKDPSKKEAIYRDGLQDFPNSAGLMTNFAVFLEGQQGRQEEAKKLYKSAFESEPEHPTYIANYGWVLRRYEKKIDEAEAVYRNGLQKFPNDPWLMKNLADLIRDYRDNYVEAEKLYTEALRLKPNDSRIIAGYAFLLDRKLNRGDEAEKLYNQAIALDPTSYWAYNNLAWLVAVTRGNLETAEKSALKALELNPNYGHSMDTLAFIYWKLGKNFSEADKLFRKAIELIPDSKEIRSNYEGFLTEHPEFSK